MYRNLLKLTLLAALVGGCASHPAPNVQVTDVPPGSFITAWTMPSGLKTVNKFYYENNLIFAYNPDNQVVGFDTKGGLKFSTQVGEPGDVVGPPMVQADRLIFPSSATLEILSPSGVHLKSMHLPQPIRSPGVVIDQTVYVGSDSETGGRMAAVALDRQYNVYRWTVLTGIVHTRPAVHDNVIYGATEDGRVFALNPDHTPLWPSQPEMEDGLFHTNGRILSALKADDAGVYVASADTKLYCLDPNTGRLRWTYFAGVALTQSPVPTADMVYIVVPGQGLVALAKKVDSKTRTPKWTFADGTQLLSDDAKYAYVLTSKGEVVAIEKATGREAFRTAHTELAKAATHIDPKDATIFGLTADNKVVAIKPVLKTGVVGALAMAEPAATVLPAN